MDGFAIRDTAIGDIPDVIEFTNASWVRTYAPLIGTVTARELATAKHVSALFGREIGAADAFSLLAVDTANRVIAHMGAFQTRNGVAYIDRFHVAPQWHGKGVASELMRCTAQQASKRGFGRMELTVLEGNDRALAFYAKAGFVKDEARGPCDGMGGKSAIPLFMTL